MVSLTKKSHITDSITYAKNNNNNNWIGSVYLCIQNSDKSSENIDGFRCFQFKNILEAEDYYNKKNYKILNDKIIYRHTMIPICKWVPFSLHKFILNDKLNRIYWKNNITFMIKKE